ncbi:MAG TPA: hypothetical protein HA292_02120 [Candidatus Nitrosotenuis sp.]|jgi:hypothetical protein|nr:hypothetical protein [Candidatus Nitrosotenuis sp.]
MPEIVCEQCGKKLFHENETTLKIEETIHKKFCREKMGATYSFMHRDPEHMGTFDVERAADQKGKSLV